MAVLCVTDTGTAYNGTEPGGGITFRGKFNSSGSTTNFATVQGVKANTTDGNYASELRFTTRAHGGNLATAMRIMADGKIANVIMKHHLPNQNVFDEKRIFDEGEISGPYQVGPIRIGSPICEDAWHSDVSETLSETGAQLLLVPNGSPYYSGKNDVRLNKMVSRVVETNMPLIYLNMVGAQDDQVFDGGTFGLNRGGDLAIKLPLFEECLEHISLQETDEGWIILNGDLAKVPCDKELDYCAMVMGLRDYCSKSGFEKVVLGLSGGIDSALVAVIASDAIGPENVRSIMLPSPYTSQASLSDAANLAENLGCNLDNLPISDSVNSIEKTLSLSLIHI